MLSVGIKVVVNQGNASSRLKNTYESPKYYQQYSYSTYTYTCSTQCLAQRIKTLNQLTFDRHKLQCSCLGACFNANILFEESRNFDKANERQTWKARAGRKKRRGRERQREATLFFRERSDSFNSNDILRLILGTNQYLS